ncbi:hypothetical protein RJT34_11860 [Clitoria ternatea]|uniref:Uncharacterized protein n=1 Tax=Clitoria ternatea TaxID=43366 RepID=A0AAN9JMT8_CLITE
MASHHVRNPNRIIIIHRIFHNPLLNARSFSSDASLPQPHPPHPSSLKDNELAKFASIADTCFASIDADNWFHQPGHALQHLPSWALRLAQSILSFNQHRSPLPLHLLQREPLFDLLRFDVRRS